MSISHVTIRKTQRSLHGLRSISHFSNASIENTSPVFMFVLQALPAVFLTNAALSMLYYVGAMQFLVGVIGTAMRFVLATSVVESTGVAASIFMEGVSKASNIK